MDTFSVEFSVRLVEAAQCLEARHPPEQLGNGRVRYPEDIARTIICLSQLACEIALKYLLQKAGVPVREIRSHNHALHSMKNALMHYNALYKTPTDDKVNPVPRSLAIVFAMPVDPAKCATVGTVLDAEVAGASGPIETRYACKWKNYDHRLWLEAARILVEDARIITEMCKSPNLGCKSQPAQ